MIRRTADKVGIVINVGTMLALFSLLYTMWRNTYNDLQQNVRDFEMRVQEVVKAQNEEIKELRRVIERRR